MFSCRYCSRSFETANGLLVHNGQIHDEDPQEKAVRIVSEQNSGENNPMHGRSHTKEARSKIAEASEERWQDESHRERVSRMVSESKTGHEVSEETRRKISESLTGRSLTEEHKEKLRGKTKGEKNGMYGLTGSDHPMHGTSLSEESKESISRKNSGEGNGMYGLTGDDYPGSREPSGPGSYHSDLVGMTFKSDWEREIAEMMQRNGVIFTYEPGPFNVGSRKYSPDFKVGTYVIEVKGHIWPDDEGRSESFMKQFPLLHYIVVGNRLPCHTHIPWEDRNNLVEVVSG